MNIIQAIKDKNLFRPFLEDEARKIPLHSWKNWQTCLRILYGLSLNPNKKEITLQCTGRNSGLLPKTGFKEALILTGRRSGKSKIAALIAAYEGALTGKEKLLSKGEIGLVAVVAPTKKQAGIVRSYIRAVFQTELLEQEIVSEDKEEFVLSNGVHITVLVGDFKTVRGFTLLAVVVDECAFFGLTEESKVRSDTELMRAIKPSLATVNGKLIAISSPYAKKGYCYTTYKKYFGNNAGKTLVWNSPSRIMNETTLSQETVDEALAEDLAAAKSEYLGEFRDDVGAYLPREVIQSYVISGRQELLPQGNITYFAFCDVSGGRGDDAALAIGHSVNDNGQKKVIIDFIRRYSSPHSPYQIIEMMIEELRRFHIRKITGDNYSAEFVKQAFESKGILYQKADLPKSQLYLEFLPLLCSGQIELLDNEILIGQFSSLERRTRSGGKDSVDHPQGGKDDVSNVVAGVCFIANQKQRVIGALFRK